MVEEPFDIDNMDLEEEMIRHDIEEEEQQEEAEQEERDSNASINNRKQLTAKNLDLDLKISVEKTRPIYRFKLNTMTYEGYVVYKFDNDAFIFNVKQKGSSETKLKKIRLSEIKQDKN